MNSQRPRWKLPPSHQELLRAAMMGGSSNDVEVSSEQRAAIRQICSGPERLRFEPEDFLIAFKLAIVDAAKAAGIPPGPDRNALLARLVTVYIEEFYRAPLADGKGTEHQSGPSFLAGSALLAITSSDAAHTSADAQPSL